MRSEDGGEDEDEAEAWEYFDHVNAAPLTDAEDEGQGDEEPEDDEAASSGQVVL